MNSGEGPQLGEAIFPPEQLIFKDECSYQVNGRLLDSLENLECPIVALSCFGQFRTGKSFLLNCFTFQNGNGGFKVGHTTDSCTKGIVAQAFPLLLNGVRKGTAIFFDIQGAKACDTTDSDDAAYSTLALLLSQVCVMNSSSVIQRGAVQDLKIFSEMARLIPRNPAKDCIYDLEETMYRTLIWVLRDFTLSLGKRSPLEYLESIIYRKGNVMMSNQKSINQGNVRDEVLSHFENMECFALPPPFSERNPQCMPSVATKQLSPNFESEMAGLRYSIMEHMIKYVIEGNAFMNGLTFAYLVRLYVGHLNKGKCIVQLNQVELQLESALYSFLNEAIDKYHQHMRCALENPVPTAYFDQVHHDAHLLSQRFLQNCLRQYPIQARRIETKLKVAIFENGIYLGGAYIEYKLQNSSKLRNYHEKLMKQLHTTYMAEHICTDRFDHQKYTAALEHVTEEFQRQSIESMEATEVFSSYVQSTNENARNIQAVQHGFDHQIALMDEAVSTNRNLLLSAERKMADAHREFRALTQALDYQASDLLHRFDELKKTQKLDSRKIDLEMDALHSEMMNYYSNRINLLNDQQKSLIKRIQTISQDQAIELMELNPDLARIREAPQQSAMHKVKPKLRPVLNIISSAAPLISEMFKNDDSETDTLEFSSTDNLATGVRILGIMTQCAKVAIPIVLSIISGGAISPFGC